MAEKKKREVRDCECCSAPEVECQEYGPQSHGGRQEPEWYCALCAGTMTSMWHSFPGIHNGDVFQAMRTTCYVGNAIIKAIREAPK